MTAREEPVAIPAGLLDRYRKILDEEGAGALRAHLKRIEDRLRYGAAEKGETAILLDELAVAQAEGEAARERTGSSSPDLLLLTLGYTPEPLLLAVAFHAPREVILLAGSLNPAYLVDLAALWDACREQLRQPAFAELSRTTRQVHDRAGAFFQAVREIVESRRTAGSPSLLVDITGAKKTMTAGAFLAAGYLDVEVSYVDFESYDPLLRRPDPGSSRPGILTHPLRLFRLREEDRLAEAFDGRRFEEALRLARSLVEMAGSPEVAEILGEEESVRRRARYGAIARATEAFALWRSGFFWDAAEAFGRESWLPLPATIGVLGAVWPCRNDSQSEIVKALAEERAFEDPSTALAYLLDVLVWRDEESLASRPRDAYLHLYGAMESAISYLLEAVHRRPGGLKVKSEGLESLEHEFPQDRRASAIDWRGELYRGSLKALRKSSTATLKALAGGEAKIDPAIDFNHLFGEPTNEDARSRLSLLAECRVTLSLGAVDQVSIRKIRRALSRYSDLRHKAVHWMAPVPREEAKKLRSLYGELLQCLIPIAVREREGAASPGQRADLGAWKERLLAAVAGTVPADCRPLRLAELDVRLREAGWRPSTTSSEEGA